MANGTEAAGWPAAWAVALEASGFSFMPRDSTCIYPLANLGHLVGLSLLILGIANAIIFRLTWRDALDD